MAKVVWALAGLLLVSAGAASAERASLFSATSAGGAALIPGNGLGSDIGPDSGRVADTPEGAGSRSPGAGPGQIALLTTNPASAVLASAVPDQRDTDPRDATPTAARSGSSLFSGTAGNSFFAPYPARPRPETPRAERSNGSAHRNAVPRLPGGSPVAQLLSLIALAEAGPDGYDAVVWAARIRTPRPPTRMTLGEIYAWIDATPGQHHAIGRYQFIPSTLRRVAAIKGMGPEVRFTPAVQDQLAIVLLEDAGLASFQTGQLDRRTFMRNLARIWAGLPLPNGKSFYEGLAGNAATMSWARFEGGMAQIWPASR